MREERKERGREKERGERDRKTGRQGSRQRDSDRDRSRDRKRRNLRADMIERGEERGDLTRETDTCRLWEICVRQRGGGGRQMPSLIARTDDSTCTTRSTLRH